MDSIQIHASCVAIESGGILLLGESGVGKSDLALRLIDRGASLISDDQTILAKKNDVIIANVPQNIAGLLEIRGIGLFALKTQSNATVRLVVQLSDKQEIERLPSPEFYDCLAVQIPLIRISPFEISAPIKIEMAFTALSDNSMAVGVFKE